MLSHFWKHNPDSAFDHGNRAGGPEEHPCRLVRSSGGLGSPGQSALPWRFCERANAVKANGPLHDEEPKLNKMTHLWRESKQTNKQPTCSKPAVPRFISRGLCQGIAHVSLSCEFLKPWKRNTFAFQPLRTKHQMTRSEQLFSRWGVLWKISKLVLSFPKALELSWACPMPTSNSGCVHRHSILGFLNLPSSFLDTSHQCSNFNKKPLHLDKWKRKIQGKGLESDQEMLRGLKETCFKVLK